MIGKCLENTGTILFWEAPNAGRRFVWVKSENGKGTMTISPFINLAMLLPLQVLTNLVQAQTHLVELFREFVVGVWL